MTATTEPLQTEPMVGFAQIVGGEAACRMCSHPAQVTLTTGPGYHDTPMCWAHGRKFVQLAIDTADRFWHRG